MKSRGKLWASQWGGWALHKGRAFKHWFSSLAGTQVWAAGEEREGADPLGMPKSIIPAKLSWGDTCTETRSWWGCDKHRFCTGLQLGLGADWTNHIPVSAVSSPGAADGCELNVSPAEAEGVTGCHPQLPRGGWHCALMAHTQPVCSCLCSTATRCHLGDSLMGVHFTILWSLREV